MIRNLEDLAKYVGAARPTAESISRRLYKDTECGVSFTTGPIQTFRSFERTYTVRWIQAITGWMVSAWRPAGGKKQARSEMPAALREYLDLSNRGTVEYDPQTIEAPQIIKRTAAPYGGLWMTVRINVTETKAKPGISVAGYAEGSDAQPTPYTLTFPFTGATFDEILAEADRDGCDLFDDAQETEE
jgi:hypothetical protein